MKTAEEKPKNVIETGEYIEPNTFENESEAILFFSYLELLDYIKFLESKNGDKQSIRIMKTEPTISIQDEVAKIHAQYGTTEMANYQIEKLFEKYVKQFSPNIKQLEWDGKEELAFFTAKTNIGEYMIDSPHHDGIFMLMYTPDWSYESFLLHTSNSTDELKSFAQRDFEQRVKECLITE